MMMYGYSSHVSYKTLHFLKDNGIFVSVLHVHMSHLLQSSDLSVFGPLNEAFRCQLSQRTVTTINDRRIDIFTICDLLSNANHKVVHAQNFIARFDSLDFGTLTSVHAITVVSMLSILPRLMLILDLCMMSDQRVACQLLLKKLQARVQGP